MNFTEFIKNDNILSHYDFGVVYVVLLRLKKLGYLCECKCKE
jgi:hypothetical protein